MSAFAQCHPHEAFCAYTHGLRHKWAYLARTVPNIDHLFKPLETLLHQRFLPVLTNRPPTDEFERKLHSLPPRLGSLGITDPTTLKKEYSYSVKVTAPIVGLITSKADSAGSNGRQSRTSTVVTEPRLLKREVVREKAKDVQTEAQELSNQLTEPLKRAMLLAQERGASSWLTALPPQYQGFNLHKGAFRDALAIRYGWELSQVPSSCVCGNAFTIDHAMICRHGGYPTLRHNEIRDLTASLLSEVCSDVQTEPSLQPVAGERLPPSSNKKDDARLDIRARGFWCNDHPAAFFDVRVFHPNAASYRKSPIESVYRRHQSLKKQEYGPRVTNIE